jgi:chaperonin GroES
MRMVGTLNRTVPAASWQRWLPLAVDDLVVPQPEASPMNFRPLHDRVVVRRLPAAEKTAGGIIIPDTAKEKPQEGEVVAVGAGVKAEDGTVTPLDVKAGDKILFGKWSGTEVKINGEDLIIMKESDILGIVG